MADNKAKNGAGGSPEKKSPKRSHRFLDDAVLDAIDEATKWGAERLSKVIVANLRPEWKEELLKDPSRVRLLKVLRFLIPNDPARGKILAKIGNEGISDLATFIKRDLEEEAKKGPSPSAPAPSPPPSPAFDKDKQIVRIQTTLTSIADRSKRDDFLVWYQGLTEKQKETFLGIVAVAKDDDLKNILQLPAGQLTALLTLKPTADSPKGKDKTLTHLELRAAIAADAALTQKVNDFLATSSTISTDTAAFWKAVESKIHTLEEFKNLMALDKDSILQHLGLDKKSVGEQAKKIVADLNKPPAAPDALDRAIDKLKTGNAALLDKLLKRVKTPRTGGAP